MQVSDRVTRLHKASPLTDVHAHPSLKAYLFHRNQWRHYCSGRMFNPFSSRSDFRMLEKGHVGLVWAAHNVPERELFDHCFWLKLAGFLAVSPYWTLRHRSPFTNLLKMMDALEREVARRPDRTEMARSVEEIERIRRAGKIAFVHTVEGAHVLEGKPEHLEEMARRGVAVLILSHFFANGLAQQTEGIPSQYVINKLCTFDFGTVRPQLTDLGREVIARCERLGIVLDLTHCAPGAREAVYAATDSGRPLIASHVGVHGLFESAYNLTDDEVREIAHRGGAIGVIFMPYWLTGHEAGPGLEAIWVTMLHVHDICGSWDHVMIGTDFDGFSDPPDDLQDASRLPLVTETLLERGVAEEDVMKILGGNAMRVLRNGWRESA